MASPRVRATRKKMDYDADDEYQTIMYKIAEEAIGKDEGCKCLSCLEHYCPVCRKEGRIGPIDGNWDLMESTEGHMVEGYMVPDGDGEYVARTMSLTTFCGKCKGIVEIDIKPEDWKWDKETGRQIEAVITGCDECKWTLDETNKAYKGRFHLHRECVKCENEEYSAWADRESARTFYRLSNADDKN